MKRLLAIGVLLCWGSLAQAQHGGHSGGGHSGGGHSSGSSHSGGHSSGHGSGTTHSSTHGHSHGRSVSHGVKGRRNAGGHRNYRYWLASNWVGHRYWWGAQGHYVYWSNDEQCYYWWSKRDGCYYWLEDAPPDNEVTYYPE